MQYFLDSADVSKIQAVLAQYPCDGVTTNPTILARDAKDPGAALRKIRKLLGNKLLFAQVTAKTAPEMISQAEALAAALGAPISIKIPATKEGVLAMKTLAVRGISVTATAVYTPQQALLCGKAGADYVAPYVSHIDNLGIDAAAVVGEMAELLAAYCPHTCVLAASFRTVEQVNRVLFAGAGAVTITAEMFDLLIGSAGTAAEVGSFEKNWSAAFGEKEITDFWG